MALAGLAMVFVYTGKNLDCAPFQKQRSQVCEAHHFPGVAPLAKEDNPISPLPLRALGTSLIIYAGAYCLLVGYLMALLTIRFGVEVPEDKSFLGQRT